MARRRQGSTGRSRTQRRARTARPIAGPAAFRDVAEPGHVLSQAATLLLIGAHLRGDTAAVRARAEASGRLLHSVARRRFLAIPPSDQQLGNHGHLILAAMTLTVGNVLVQVPPLAHTTGTTEPAFEVFDGRGHGFCYFAPDLAETIRSRFGFHRAMC
jgi:hypothetical protein